jgi:Amidohydrolase family
LVSQPCVSHVWQANNAADLVAQAQIGHHYGLPADKAIASVMSVPATTMGLSHRIGYLQPGYDADLVLWDSHPLCLGTSTLQTWIDGKPLVSNVDFSNLPVPGAINPPPQRGNLADLGAGVKSCTASIGLSAFVVTGIKQAYLRDGKGGLDEHNSSDHPLTMVYIDGKIKCLDQVPKCSDWVRTALGRGANRIALKNGFLVPV